jgi:ABC-type Mn2+/Zn2+ transport system ATPase subunit
MPVDLLDRRERADRLLAEYRSAKQQIVQEKEFLASARELSASAEEAQKILQGVAQAVQEVAHDRMATVVTRCLQAVFSDAYEFRILFEQKRGKTEAKLTFARGGVVLEDPLNEASGGMVQVAALALVLANLVARLPPARRFLALDEPFPGVSAANADRVNAMTEALARDLGVQFLIATHNELLEVGTVYQIKKKGRGGG